MPRHRQARGTPRPDAATSGRSARYVAPVSEPDRVRDDDPDEADQPAHRDRGGRADGCGDDEHEPHAPHVHPEARGLVVSDAQHVEDAPVREDHGARDRRRRGRSARRRSSRCVGSPPRIHDQTSCSVSVFCCWTKVCAAVKNARDGDAREHERRGIPLAPCGAADRVGERDRRRARRGTPRAGAPRWPPRLVRQVRDRECRAEPRARRRPRGDTDRQAGSGTRPGTPHRRARASLRRGHRGPRGGSGSPRGSSSSTGSARTRRRGPASRAPIERRMSPTPRSTGPAAMPTSERRRRGSAAAANAQPGGSPRGRTSGGGCGLRGGRPHVSSRLQARRRRSTSPGRSRRAAAPSGRRPSRRCGRSTRSAPRRPSPIPAGRATVDAFCAAADRVGEHDQVGARRDDVLRRELRVAGARRCRRRRRCSSGRAARTPGR